MQKAKKRFRFGRCCCCCCCCWHLFSKRLWDGFKFARFHLVVQENSDILELYILFGPNIDHHLVCSVHCFMSAVYFVATINIYQIIFFICWILKQYKVTRQIALDMCVRGVWIKAVSNPIEAKERYSSKECAHGSKKLDTFFSCWKIFKVFSSSSSVFFRFFKIEFRLIELKITFLLGTYKCICMWFGFLSLIFSIILGKNV